MADTRSSRKTSGGGIAKAPTGVPGLDEILRGGLPLQRTTLIAGGPGSGKTVLGLQSLVHGARALGEPGIFVAFEESAERIVRNSAGFGWDLPALQKKKLFFLDAQPSPDLARSGSVDLQGLLAALEVKVARMKAKRVVFDSVDVLMGLLGDPMEAQREVSRLHEWLLARELTAVITARTDEYARLTTGPTAFIPFMVDCAIGLRHEEVDGVSQRSLRVLKFRGASFSENAAPLLIGAHGMEVASGRGMRNSSAATSERISSGVPHLDTMLGGGYFRGASILITGAPGTAKTTLGGAFLQAACARGEHAALVTFDSEQTEIVRNLASVNVRLAGHVRSGLLRVHAVSAISASAEAHLLAIRALILEHRPTCLVIDPVSALGKQGNERTAHGVIERLIDWAKEHGVTILCTSLLGAASLETEGSPLQISTIADSWIHLSYVVHAGERNRALTIVKSRGTAHSNQVRELLLGARGVSLTDVYTAEGAVLMGSLRWQREQADLAAEERRTIEHERQQLEALRQQADLRAQLASLQRALELREAELALLSREAKSLDSVQVSGRAERRRRRGGGSRARG